jgi:hypothetical protein
MTAGARHTEAVAKKQPSTPPFRDVVTEVEQSASSAGPSQTWPQPIADGVWTDSAHVRWRRRGLAPLAVKQVKRLLLEPGVGVLLCYELTPRMIPPAERAALWARVEPVLQGREDAPAFSAFNTAEFTDEDGHRLLVLEESC